MIKEMIGQWTFITKQLKKLYYCYMMRKADEIRQYMFNIYGTDITTAWKSDYKAIKRRYKKLNTVEEKLIYLKHLALMKNYCIACERGENCNNCSFGKIAGICSEKDTLYSNFLKDLNICIRFHPGKCQLLSERIYELLTDRLEQSKHSFSKRRKRAAWEEGLNTLLQIRFKYDEAIITEFVEELNNRIKELNRIIELWGDGKRGKAFCSRIDEREYYREMLIFIEKERKN